MADSALGAMTVDLEYIIYEKKDHVARLTINRPEVRNALNLEAHREMRRAFEDFRDDDDMWIAVLTGSGDQSFCAGADLKASARRMAADEPVPDFEFGGITRNWECWKPIIASVNGYALGGGLEILLACDLAIASDTAQLGLPEPRRGIIAGAGGAVRLPRQIPSKAAMHMLLSGRPISAARALELNLVNEVVPQAELADQTQRLVDELLECSPHAMRLTKQLATAYAHLPLDEALAAQAGIIDQLWSSTDPVEGAKAFAEKRAPQWGLT